MVEISALIEGEVRYFHLESEMAIKAFKKFASNHDIEILDIKPYNKEKKMEQNAGICPKCKSENLEYGETINIKWLSPDEIDKTGMILALCQDNTGIYNQIMDVIVDKKGKTFYEKGTLGSSFRVYPDKIKAVAYIETICPDSIIKKYTNM